MRQWLPLADAVLAAAVDLLPSPIDAQQERADSLFESESKNDEEVTTFYSVFYFKDS